MHLGKTNVKYDDLVQDIEVAIKSTTMVHYLPLQKFEDPHPRPILIKGFALWSRNMVIWMEKNQMVEMVRLNYGRSLAGGDARAVADFEDGGSMLALGKSGAKR